MAAHPARGNTMIDQLRQHRAALIAVLSAALILSLAGLAAGDVELALLPWTLPAAVLVGLWWELWHRRDE